MLVKRSLIIIGVTLTSVLGAAACGTPGIEYDTGAGVFSSPPAPTSTQGQRHGDGVVVDVTPMTATELALRPPDQTEPGAAGEDGAAPAPPDVPDGQPQMEPIELYTDTTYQFRVSYPANFVFRIQPDEQLAQLEPLPVASILFMSPETAASDVADLELPDLEIRVYAADQVASLEHWLTAHDLLPADDAESPKSFQTAHVAGAEVCASTMIAPGCSYFSLGNGWVYQLRPASLAGEAMIDTFMLLAQE